MAIRYHGKCKCGTDYTDIGLPLPRPTAMFVTTCMICKKDYVELRPIKDE